MPSAIIIQADKPRTLTPLPVVIHLHFASGETSFGTRFLTAKEVAETLSCSLRHVLTLIEVGKLLAFNFAGAQPCRACWRIPPAGLERFLRDAQAA